MSYVKIDNAIDIILKYGRHSWLCKYDISNAFKNCPILPSQWPLFCIKWEDKYYFYVRLTFGCRSSPIIFDTLSQAICYIATNNYKVNNILHLLDDFLTIDPPHAEGERSMALMMMIFKRLNVQIAMHKTVGPVTCLEYLGIILDSEKMEARLPQEKVDRIYTTFQNPGTRCRHFSGTVSQNLRCNMVLKQTVEQLWTTSISKRTKDAYDIGFMHFKRYLLLNNVTFTNNLAPVSEEILIYFVAHCQTVLKLHYSTIKLYLCGIRYNYLKENCSDPLELYNGKPLPRLTLILNSVKRSQNQNKRIRLPITFDILEQIIKSLRKGVFSKFIDLMIETASVISFFGFLRCGEITVIKSEHFEPAINLCISDISFTDNIANLHLKQSKTDPFRKGIDIQLHKINSHICPYRVLKRYLEIRKTFLSSYQNTDPLFVSIGNLAMERDFFITKIRYVLELCGYNPKNFSGHSFRIGAGTAAGQAKIEDHMIKTLGRWSSDCYVRYIRTQPISIKHAQQQLAESFNH
ncbi:unnamed protein product [Mytilus edulis]|uniref:Reverse transcriptase domain-containing protein n=1 Tax=Mytilus edulis TaxID=6550 RepID=A0A8S3QLM4_MYTED|nr:unnamed protein product [Mytilus edulis]